MNWGTSSNSSRFPDDEFRFCWTHPESYRELFTSTAPCRRPWAMGLIIWLVYLLAAEVPIILGHIIFRGSEGFPLLLIGLVAGGGLAICLSWSWLAAATSYRTSTTIISLVLLAILVTLVAGMVHYMEASHSG